jgi:hypothetical protein
VTEGEPRGTVLVKGKGPMETWYLVGPRSDVVRTEEGQLRDGGTLDPVPGAIPHDGKT